MHIADFEKSNPRLAGLMLRCSKTGIETIIVVIQPFPPQAHPKITLQLGGPELYFEGTATMTGTGLIVPVDGMELARGAWSGANELSVKIVDGDVEIKGVVALAGLSSAI